MHKDAFEHELAKVVPPSKRKEIPLYHEIEEASPLRIRVTWRLGPMISIPPEAALHVGDALTNYRAALDHLAWIITKRVHGLAQLDERARRGVAFPMARNSGTFPNAMKRNLPGLDLGSPIGKLVRRCQPFGRTWQSQAMRALRNLSDRDKHRLLIPTFWFPETLKFDLDPLGFSILDQRPLVAQQRRAIKVGTPIFTAELTSTSLQQPEVDLKCEATLYPALGGSWAAMPLLTYVGDAVEEILDGVRDLL
ncbi:MAG: hypothetical protein WD757_09195 [Actinomycetota bacterium]